MPDHREKLLIKSPVGVIQLSASKKHLTSIIFGGNTNEDKSQQPASSILKNARHQLHEYFSEQRTIFNLPLQPDGTNFQKEVWEELSNVDYGSTVTYSTLAKRLGDVNKVRAVGRANGQNPLPIIIPCHRVIGSTNTLTGYSGGIEHKKWLLRHEGILLL